MRSIIVIAILATAITMGACKRFQAPKQNNSSFSLHGDWKLDSLAAGKDTNSLAPLLFALAAVDTNQQLSLKMTFTDNNIITTYADATTDSVAYTVDTTKHSLQVKGKGDQPEYLTYAFRDSAHASIALKDSTILYLSRK